MRWGHAMACPYGAIDGCLQGHAMACPYAMPYPITNQPPIIGKFPFTGMIAVNQ